MARSVHTVEQLSGDNAKFYDAVNAESDMACILLCSSYLDQCLATLLHKFFIEGSTSDSLLKYNGALGSFATRCNLAYCLGLIGKWSFQNLTNILEIRNVLAHSHLEIDFTTPDV